MSAMEDRIYFCLFVCFCPCWVCRWQSRLFSAVIFHHDYIYGV